LSRKAQKKLSELGIKQMSSTLNKGDAVIYISPVGIRYETEIQTAEAGLYQVKKPSACTKIFNSHGWEITSNPKKARIKPVPAKEK